mmetsp:Transcript_14099/g.33846  ORF Transcript_14099/g.33846 Transcript_14099/m.33846 type:complete len:269 (-) Transcript_14099:3287-4093(-)
MVVREPKVNLSVMPPWWKWSRISYAGTMSSTLILVPATVTGAVTWNILRKSSTLAPNPSLASRILRASSCCIRLSFSRTLSIFFFSALHASGASSRRFSTLSCTLMPYVLSSATVATSGSNMASVFSWRLRTSRISAITSYSMAWRSLSSTASSVVGSFSKHRLPLFMNSYSSSMLWFTLVPRYCVYRNTHLVTHVLSACLMGLASILIHPITLVVLSAWISSCTALYRAISLSNSASSGSSPSLPLASTNSSSAVCRSFFHRYSYLL